MKNLRLLFLSLFSTTLFFACQKNQEQLATSGNQDLQAVQQSMNSEGSNAYVIALESHSQVGANWEWVWSVRNPNPGNGYNGTVQDLSHWGMQFGTCVDLGSLVSAAYSNNGSSWNSFSPNYTVDPSQECVTMPVLKFDFGTTGDNKSYYKLVTSQDYPIGTQMGYYKSGQRTGCAEISFTGISCETDPTR